MRNNQLSRYFLIAAVSTVVWSSFTTSLLAHQPCHTVNSRQGWQNVDFPSSGLVTEVLSISGSWSVDDRRYSRVGAAGHWGNDAASLSPYNQYKYDSGYPFGTLLLDIPTNGHGYIPVTGPMRLPYPISRTSMRINDKDEALGDNGGSLTVCFQHVHSR